MNTKERRLEVMRLINNGMERNTELCKATNVSNDTTVRDKQHLMKHGMIERQGEKNSKSQRFQLTRIGLKELGLDPGEYMKFEKIVTVQYMSRAEEIFDRRMSVTAYLSFSGKFVIMEMAKLLGVDKNTITADIKVLKKSGWITKAERLTEKGREKLYNYDCGLY